MMSEAHQPLVVCKPWVGGRRINDRDVISMSYLNSKGAQVIMTTAATRRGESSAKPSRTRAAPSRDLTLRGFRRAAKKGVHMDRETKPSAPPDSFLRSLDKREDVAQL